MSNIKPVSYPGNYPEDLNETAALKLMDELNRGRLSGENEGWIEADKAEAFFRRLSENPL